MRDREGTVIGQNNDSRDEQEAEITASGLAPKKNREAALIVNVTGTAEINGYTAQLTGAGNTAGIGLVEVYDLEAESFADLGNISTRGQVGTGDNVLIGGLIVRDDSNRNRSQDILLRGIGPSLRPAVQNPLEDPQIELFNAQGTSIGSNDNYKVGQNPKTIPLKPESPKEAALRRTLAPGAYTVILRGADSGTGIGLVEAYNLGNQ